MNTGKFLVGKYINAEYVKTLAEDKRKAVVVGKPYAENFTNKRKGTDGKEVEVTQQKMVIPIEINGEKLLYVPNKNGIRSLNEALGVESDEYVGAVLSFSTAIITGTQPAVIVSASKPKKK